MGLETGLLNILQVVLGTLFCMRHGRRWFIGSVDAVFSSGMGARRSMSISSSVGSGGPLLQVRFVWSAILWERRAFPRRFPQKSLSLQVLCDLTPTWLTQTPSPECHAWS